MMRKGAKSTVCLIDQFIPELWERTAHPYLGTPASLRYRFVRQVESKIAMFKIRRTEPPVLAVPYEVLVESHFRTLNACLVTGEDRLLREVATDEFARTLKDKSSSFPMARVIKFNKPPELVQSRIFAMSEDPDDSIAQLTFKVTTEQKLLGSSSTVEELFPVSYQERKTWFPYQVSKLGAVHYFYPLSGDKQARLVPSMRFTPLPLPVRGTFGSSGHITRKQDDMVLVENHVVLEKLMKFSRGSEWKIHHF